FFTFHYPFRNLHRSRADTGYFPNCIVAGTLAESKKMKLFLTIFGLFGATLVFGQNTGGCDSILWTKERKLSWNDFKAPPDTTTEDVSLSSIRLYYRWKLSGDTLIIIVSNWFRPCFAWSKVKNSDSLLIHEQG